MLRPKHSLKQSLPLFPFAGACVWLDPKVGRGLLEIVIQVSSLLKGLLMLFRDFHPLLLQLVVVVAAVAHQKEVATNNVLHCFEHHGVTLITEKKIAFSQYVLIII
jgi:hypothetical protein